MRSGCSSSESAGRLRVNTGPRTRRRYGAPASHLGARRASGKELSVGNLSASEFVESYVGEMEGIEPVLDRLVTMMCDRMAQDW